MEAGETPQLVKKEPLINRALRKVFSPERATEFLSGQIMMQVEIMHDMQLYPAKYGMTPAQAGSYFVPESPPAAKWAMDHIGDIWEISAGFTAMRLGFVALNEILKSDRATGLQKKLLQSEKAKEIAGRFIKVDKVNKIAEGQPVQISDEACFWTSLMTTWTVKAVHSMGWISLFHIHDHMANPVPEMIFGQGVAAAVLVGSHYAAKYREPIKNLAVKFGKGIVEGAKTFDRKFNEFDQRIADLNKPRVNPNLAVDAIQVQNKEEVHK